MRSLGDRLSRPVLLGGLAVLVVAAVIVVFPAVLVRPAGKITATERLKAENDVRTTLIQALGGLVLLSGVYFSARTLQTTRRGQITERFTRAIAQLGDDKLDVRLGGIYALERIARDSEQDHGPIMEVLTAFVREHAKWDADASGVPHIGADVQAVATVLGRRPEERRREETQPLDLTEVDLRKCRLDYAHLEGVWLPRAHLEEIRLADAHLERADLWDAHLEGAILGDTHLRRANLSGAHLEGAFLCGAHLEGAYLDGAHLDGADLRQAHLEGAHLSKANGLTRAQVESANINPITSLPEWPENA
ncbi:MAG: pentapeptide repeat-containing protein [Actinomycetota bacterium]|nr:pentapeptide repeat-containing protein [Actinomycetota bacterium]